MIVTLELANKSDYAKTGKSTKTETIVERQDLTPTLAEIHKLAQQKSSAVPDLNDCIFQCGRAFFTCDSTKTKEAEKYLPSQHPTKQLVHVSAKDTLADIATILAKNGDPIEYIDTKIRIVLQNEDDEK